MDELSKTPEPLALASRCGIRLDRLRSLAASLYANREAELPSSQQDAGSLLELADQLVERGVTELEGLAPACAREEDLGLAQIKRFSLLRDEWRILDEPGRVGLLLTRMNVKPAGNMKNWSPPETLRVVKAIVMQFYI